MKTYKAIWLTPELAKEIKLKAVKENKTIIQFISELLPPKEHKLI